MPFSLAQSWPFCWWVAIAVDHFSRRVMGFAAFKQQPTSEAVRAFLGRAIRTAGTTPKHLVVDKGVQFRNAGFKAWCKRKGIQPRFGAIGRHGSIAVVERLILSLKTECLAALLVPYSRDEVMRELQWYGQWHNGSRPHTKLGGRTPDEVYHAKRPANRSPRFEPRPGWPRGSPCAAVGLHCAANRSPAWNSRSRSITGANTCPRELDTRRMTQRGRRSPHRPRRFHAEVVKLWFSLVNCQLTVRLASPRRRNDSAISSLRAQFHPPPACCRPLLSAIKSRWTTTPDTN